MDKVLLDFARWAERPKSRSHSKISTYRYPTTLTNFNFLWINISNIHHNSINSSIMNKLKRNSDEISNLRVDNFRDVLWPVYYTLKLLGLLPFSLNSRESPRCFMSKWNKITFGLQFLLHFILMIVVLSRTSDFLMYGNNRISGYEWISNLQAEGHWGAFEGFLWIW